MIITKDMLRKLCRYEWTFSEMTKNNPDGRLRITEPYIFTLEDLYAALVRYTEKRDRKEFEEDWYRPVLSAIERDIILDEEMDVPDVYDSMGMPDRYTVFSDAWTDLYETIEVGEGPAIEEILENMTLLI